MDDLKKFSAAILAGIQQNQGGAGISGISDEVNKAYGSRMRAPLIDTSEGVGAIASEVDQHEKKAAEVARQAKLRELQDALDPSKYRRERKADGGFAFFDPSGKEIDINTFAQRTGIRRVDAIKDSENPLDLQFMSDYNNMETIMKRAFNGEDVSMDLQANGLNSGLKPQDLNSELIRKYPHIFGVGTYQQSRANLNKPVFKLPSSGGMFPGAGGLF